MFASSFSQDKLSFLGETFQSLSIIDVSAETELSRQGGSSEEVRRLLISTEEVPVMIKTCFQYSAGMSVHLEMLTPQIHSDAIHKGFAVSSATLVPRGLLRHSVLLCLGIQKPAGSGGGIGAARCPDGKWSE